MSVPLAKSKEDKKSPEAEGDDFFKVPTLVPTRKKKIPMEVVSGKTSSADKGEDKAEEVKVRARHRTFI